MDKDFSMGFCVGGSIAIGMFMMFFPIWIYYSFKINLPFAVKLSLILIGLLYINNGLNVLFGRTK